MKKLILPNFIICLILLSFSVSALSPYRETVEEEFKSSKAIFFEEVISIKNFEGYEAYDNYNEITFKVKKFWKGSNYGTSEGNIKVLTQQDTNPPYNGIGGYYFIVGEEYLVFTTDFNNDTKLETSAITNTIAIENAEETIGKLNSLSNINNSNKIECTTDSECPDLDYSLPDNNDKSFKCVNGKCKVRIDCPESSIEEEGKCKKTLSNGIKSEIKIMPSTASQKAMERLGELGFNIILKEVGQGENAKAVYELTAEKEGKILGIFKAKGEVSAEVDAETGEVIKVHKPWWAFLARGI